MSRIGAALGEARLDTRIRAVAPRAGARDTTRSRHLAGLGDAGGAAPDPRAERAAGAARKTRSSRRRQVIATTFGTLARLAPGLPPAETAVVDEATQAIEPAVWVAVPFVRAAGDRRRSGAARAGGQGARAARSTSRCSSGGCASGSDLPMLEEQHRMVPVDPGAGRRGLRSPATSTRRRCRARTPFFEPAALWIDTAGAGGEQCDLATMSLYDPLEVDVAAIAVAEAAGCRRRAGGDRGDRAVQRAGRPAPEPSGPRRRSRSRR